MNTLVFEVSIFVVRFEKVVNRPHPLKTTKK